MLAFTEEILLLLLDDDDGTFAPIRKDTLSCALAGAALMDLAFANRIDTEPGRLIVIDPAPTGDAGLDRILEKINAHTPAADTHYWVKTLSLEDADAIRDESLASLVDKGILERKERKFLWPFRDRRYPAVDGRPEREVKRRIENQLLSGDIPEARDVALICLANACDILPSIFQEDEMARIRPRLVQLRKMDLIGREVADAIAEIERVAMLSLASAPYSPY